MRPDICLTRGNTSRRGRHCPAIAFDIRNGPRDRLAVSGTWRPYPVGEERPAHRRRRAGDEEPDALAPRLGRNPAHRIGRGGIQKWHRGEIDHERLAGIGDAVEHRSHRRCRTDEKCPGDAVHWKDVITRPFHFQRVINDILYYYNDVKKHHLASRLSSST